MHVVSLGHDTKIFDTTSRPYARQLSYAQKITMLTILIPTKESQRPVNVPGLSVVPVTAWNPLLRFWRLWRETLRQVRRSKKAGPTLLTVQSPFEFGLIGLVIRRLTGVLLEVQVHGDFYSRDYWRLESWGNRLRAGLGLFVLRRATGVRVVSERIASSLIARGVPRARITVLPIVTSLTAFQTASPRPLWPDQSKATIIAVARFSREKNLHLLIKAFKQVHQREPQTQLVLVGEGSEETSLRAQVARLWPNDAPVLFYPWQNDIASVMKAADIFALTSDYEGYAMVLGEAMAAGLAIVTTDVGCVGELCLPDKEALVVPPRDEATLVVALTRLVADADLRQRLSAAGLTTISTLATSDESYASRIVGLWRLITTSK
jgi:glycosyltransferase involved in cell wall biosynthesis